MAAIFWKFKLFDVALIWPQIRNLRPQISGIGPFWTPFIHFLTLIYYLPKFRRNLQVCSFDGFFVRLSVCLSVCDAIQVAVFDQFTVNLVHFEPPLFIFWRLFITCQNFEEICKYVRLTVCLSVCLFVCLFVTRYRSQFLTNLQ